MVKNETTFQKPDGVGEEQAASHLLRALQAAGYSSTLPRRAIIRVIAHATGYLNPVQIRDQARQWCPRLGLVTVYRTLDLLAEMGLVRKVHLAGGCHSYAVAQQGHRHHIICRECQQVAEFDGCDLSDVFASVERQTGYAVNGHWLELLGLCPRCVELAAGASGASGHAILGVRGEEG